MPTNLEKAQKRRLRIVEYYANGWEFIIRLLMGLGIYVVLRILLMSYLAKVQNLSFNYADSLSELAVLLVSAVLMILFIWFKGSRSHLATALWMPVLLCLVLMNAFSFIAYLINNETLEAVFGILPFLCPLLIFVIYWACDPDSLILRIVASLLFLGMSIFWISDIPKSLEEAQNVQDVVGSYEKFSQTLQEKHMLDYDKSPLCLKTNKVKSEWQLNEVEISDYKIDNDIPEIEKMSYVSQSDMMILGINNNLDLSTQELSYSTLKHIPLHYFFKYVRTRTIITNNFQYTGNAFFVLELKNGEKIVVDNVLIRKQ